MTSPGISIGTISTVELNTFRKPTYDHDAMSLQGTTRFAFWKRSVSEPLWTTIDPVLSAPFKITQKMKIATAGSCFAQHIARHLKNSGYNYYVSESAPLMN